jgi:hypothetical protein
MLLNTAFGSISAWQQQNIVALCSQICSPVTFGVFLRGGFVACLRCAGAVRISVTRASRGITAEAAADAGSRESQCWVDRWAAEVSCS